MTRRVLIFLVPLFAGLLGGCAATRMTPTEVSLEKNPRIMGVVTDEGQTIRFDRQRDTITWRADTLRVVSRDTTRLFARERIREVLVDKGAHGRMFAAAIPFTLLLTLLLTLAQLDNYT